jgi:hypothetical protein
MATFAVMPFMYANGQDQFRKPISAIALFLFPIVCSVFFTFLWVDDMDASLEFGPFVFVMSTSITCLCCLVYFVQYSWHSKASYMNKHQVRNGIYVARLLLREKTIRSERTSESGSESVDENFVCMLHPIYKCVFPPAGGAGAGAGGVSKGICKSDGATTTTTGTTTGTTTATTTATTIASTSLDNDVDSNVATAAAVNIHANGDLNTSTCTYRESEYILRNTTSTIQTDGRYIYSTIGTEPESTGLAAKTEVPLSDFFLALPTNWRIVWRDIKKNTPQLILLGGLIGSLALALAMGYTIKVKIKNKNKN